MEATDKKYDIFEIVITLWEFVGERMYHRSRILIFYRIFNFVLLMMLVAFATASFFKEEHGTYVKIVESIVGMVHIQFKYSQIIFNKPKIEKLLNSRRNTSWGEEDLNESVILRDQKTYKFIRSLQKTFMILATCCTFLVMSRPILYKNHLYILETWSSTNSDLLNAFILISQYYAVCIVIPVIFGYDAVYLAFCVHLVIQVRHLKFKLRKLSASKKRSVKDYLIQCIEQHQFLISMFTLMNDIYTMTFFFHYFITLFSCCIELYEFMGRSYGSLDVAQFLNICILFFEFAFYAFPAEQVASEFSEVPMSMYMSSWYENETKIQKLILTTMVCSQREEYFSGGGIITMNVDAFGAVVRKTFSFYAVLRNILDK